MSVYRLASCGMVGVHTCVCVRSAAKSQHMESQIELEREISRTLNPRLDAERERAQDLVCGIVDELLAAHK